MLTIPTVICALVIANASALAVETELDSAAQREVLAGIARELDAGYFEPDHVGVYLDRLEALAGRGGPAMPADDFALHVHRALQDALPDGHMGVYGPDRASRLLGAWHGDEANGSPVSQVDDHAEGATPWFAHHRLPGDVDLLVLPEFPGDPVSSDELVTVLSGIPDGRSLLFDLRGNLGGEAALFRHLAGCLFAESGPLFAIRWREGDGFRNAVSRVEPEPRCQHLADSPVVVLVNDRTGSVGELMPFILQARDRAVIVGEPTYGASHAAEIESLPHGFALMLPVGATHDPLTGDDWEGRGVEPDVVASGAAAMTAALNILSRQRMGAP